MSLVLLTDQTLAFDLSSSPSTIWGTGPSFFSSSRHHWHQRCSSIKVRSSVDIVLGRPLKLPTRLCASSGSPSWAVAATSIRDRLGLHDRFDRWRFLQNLLDEETLAEDTNQILYFVLMGYLGQYITNQKFGEPPPSAEASVQIQKSQEEGWFVSDAEEELAEMTRERREKIQAILDVSEAAQSVNLLFPADVESSDVSILEQVEGILPDPVEEEEAFKSNWDTVIEVRCLLS